VRKVLCSLGIGPHADLLELAKPTYETYAHLNRPGFGAHFVMCEPRAPRSLVECSTLLLPPLEDASRGGA